MRVLRPTDGAGSLDRNMATRKRHTPEQVVRKLVTADRLLSEGKDVAAVCRELGVSEPTYHRWRNQFGGLKADDARRLKDLERENGTLKRLLADAELEKAALKEIARGKFWARSAGGLPFVISSGCWGSVNGLPAG
jgi:putative transposase